ncbi:sister chromatid cohesion protein PDS5 homolog B [Trichonephila inaurata madagascariensis]|uniref:Sister chromatid cohesion protein PDS5 homolog B n=1 Tax=Trichonephila inaurata madagascariensis TaxID=2747483 RepID=A0A8X6YU84_9ARAC|nr:sister chromatid cohesion protein PDS5 homolog B [Trichonephila inaurata madagascariensis]
MDDPLENVVYPPGTKDLTEEVSTEELICRLKGCADVFRNILQNEQNALRYEPLAHLLITERFLEHKDREVRLLVACLLADIFRICAPEEPYREPIQIKLVMEFFVDQLKILESPLDPSLIHIFYLLENLAVVKTFNICLDVPDFHHIICQLFKVIFRVSGDLVPKIKRHILNLLCPLINESDVVTQELLDIILILLVEPIRSQRLVASSLAKEIFLKTATALEPHIQAFFNNAFILGASVHSSLSSHLYQLIYEINLLNPGVLLTVIPQLESKLKSTDTKERSEVAQIVGRMFSDKNSNMIETHKLLWECFLDRFNDINKNIRLICVSFVREFLVYHPNSRQDITAKLKHRHRDSEPEVRAAVVIAVAGAAREDLSCLNEDLMNYLKERTLDKMFRVRREAVTGLGRLHKHYLLDSVCPDPQAEAMLSFVKNKLLSVYYQPLVEDRLIVERVFNTCLVPYQRPLKERLKIFYDLFLSVDDCAIRCMRDMLQSQKNLRDDMRKIIEYIQLVPDGCRESVIPVKIKTLSRELINVEKAAECIKKFCLEMEQDNKLRNMMITLLDGSLTSSECEARIKEILETLGAPVQTNLYYVVIKQLLEKIVPVWIDKEGVKYVVSLIKDCVSGDAAKEPKIACRGMELISVLSFGFPHFFTAEELYNDILDILCKNNSDEIVPVLQALSNVIKDVKKYFPGVCVKLIPIMIQFVKLGSKKQAKHAIKLIFHIVDDKQKVFGELIEHLKEHFTFNSQHFKTALASVGYIAFLCHDMFAAEFKNVVAKVVVKDLLMMDKDLPQEGEELWVPLESLREVIKIKMEGMKVMVRWLIGMRDMIHPAMSTLRLLCTVIAHNGDLMEKNCLSPAECSWMRVSAASCMLRLCREPEYAASLNLEQFTVLAFLINDKCPELRERFCSKLNKGLYFLKLPLEFLAILALGSLDARKEFLVALKKHFFQNVCKRRRFIKDHCIPPKDISKYLPDYAIMYLVYLLAHAPFFPTYNDVPALLKIRHCLSFFFDALMTKNDAYSFSFYIRILETIKQTKDKINPTNKSASLKLYAVCDVGLHILMTRPDYVWKDFPGSPNLDSKFFSEPDLERINLKTYLPLELMKPEVLAKAGFDVYVYDNAEEKEHAIVPSTSTKKSIRRNINPSRVSKSQENPIPSFVSNQSKVSASSDKTKTVSKGASFPAEKNSNSRVTQQPKTFDVSRKITNKSNISKKLLTPIVRRVTRSHPIQEVKLNNGHIDNIEINSKSSSEIDSNKSRETDSSNSVNTVSNDLADRSSDNLHEMDIHETNLDKDAPSVKNHKIPQKSNKILRVSINKLPPNLENDSKSLSDKFSVSEDTPSLNSHSIEQNGSLSPSITSIKLSNQSSLQYLIKQCNVYLRRTEVNDYLNKRSLDEVDSGDFQNLDSSSNRLDGARLKKRGRSAKEKKLPQENSSSNHMDREYLKKRGRPAKETKKSPQEKSNTIKSSVRNTIKSPVGQRKFPERKKTLQKPKPTNYLSESSKKNKANIRKIQEEIAAEINAINNVHPTVKTKSKPTAAKRTEKSEEQPAAKRR